MKRIDQDIVEEGGEEGGEVEEEFGCEEAPRSQN